MRLILSCTLALALAFAGCGGDDKKKAEAPVAPTPAPAAAAGADSAVGSAFENVPDEQAPVQRGTLVADSGFRASRDGFSFENYARTRHEKMRPAEIRELFGDDVCVDPQAADCVLIPAADRWRQMLNAQYVNGHCYGFTVLSLLLYTGAVDRSAYGDAATTWELPIANREGDVINPELYSDLTRSAVMQQVAGVQRKVRRYTPTEAVEKLRAAFNAGERDYTLSFSFPGVGGHAVVPTGIEDMGGGKFDILLYDNNMPYIAAAPELSDRRMRIDTNADRWEYSISINPTVKRAQWSGVGMDNPLRLNRAADHALPQPCPFCDEAPATARTSVALTGDPARRGKLQITDAQGRVTGWNGNRQVNEIPGAQIRTPLVIQRENVDPPPTFEVPSGRGYTVKLVDVPDGAPAGTIHVSGPDLGVGLSGVTAAGTALRISESGAVALDQGSGGGPAPKLNVALGDQEVTVVPESDRVSLTPTRGDGVAIAGAVRSAVAEDAGTGETKRLPSKRVDLGALFGSG